MVDSDFWPHPTAESCNRVAEEYAAQAAGHALIEVSPGSSMVTAK